MLPSPNETERTSPFASFGDSMNVHDRKHMSIIDDPSSLSPGGNTTREQKHTTPYRLSDLVSLTSPQRSKEDVRQPSVTGEDGGAGEVQDPFSSPRVRAGSEKGTGEVEDLSTAPKVGSGMEDEQTPLQARRTSGSPDDLRESRVEYLGDIGSGSEGGDGSDAGSVAHSDDAKGVASSRKSSIDDGEGNDNASENRFSAVEEEGNEGSGSSNRRDKALSEADIQSTTQQNSAFTKKLAAGVCWLWETSSHSDLSISSGEQNFSVHRSILAAQSQHFHEKLLQHPQEVLRLDDDDPEALKSMLQYLYIGSLAMPDPRLITPGGPGVLATLDTLLKVYELGCKYDFPNLKQEAVKQYTALLSTKWEKGHAVFLAKVLMKIFKMADAAKGEEEWFANGAEELRAATLEVAVDRAEELVEDAAALEVLDGAALRALVAKVVKSHTCCHGEVDGDDVDSSSGVSASGCSAEKFWR